MKEAPPRTAWEARKAREEVTRLLRRIRALKNELGSPEQRLGADATRKQQELDRLRWRLASAARRTVPSEGGATW